MGEGAVWSAAEGLLWWVDIRKAKLHRYNPKTGNSRRYDLPIHASGLAVSGGGLIMVGDREYGWYDPATEAYETFQNLDGLAAGTRTNDIGVSPDGALIVGTVDDQEATSRGEYFLIRGKSNPPEKIELPVVTVTNSMVFSPNGGTFYTCDTTEQTIYAYTVREDGRFSDGRRFASAYHPNGFPDGSAIDEEGCLWTCEWGAGFVVRRRPNGEVDTVVELASPTPSSCAFGGDEMRTLFITTAWHGLTKKRLEEYPMSGGLFATDVDVPGLLVPEFEI